MVCIGINLSGKNKKEAKLKMVKTNAWQCQKWPLLSSWHYLKEVMSSKMKLKQTGRVGADLIWIYYDRSQT